MHNLSVLTLRDGNDAEALVHAQAALDVAVEIANPPLELLARIALGQAELALGRHASATAAFESALDKALALENDGLVYAVAMGHEARAGMARVALAQGDLDGALAHVERLLPYLDAGDTLVGGVAGLGTLSVKVAAA